MGSILIRGAKQLLTLRGPRRSRRGVELNELGSIQDGALLIADGVLQQVGPTRRLENLREARNAVEINAAGRVVMPGFVDSHTHLAFPPPGGDPSQTERALHAVRGRSSKRLAGITRSYLEGMARHGTTTVEAKTGAGPDVDIQTKLLRSLGAVKRDPVDVIATMLLTLPDAGCAEAADRYCRELLPIAGRRRLAQFVDFAWESQRCLPHALRRCIEAAGQLGFARKMHADADHLGESLAMAAAHCFTSVDHLDRATEAEVRQIAESQQIATLVPAAFRGCHAGVAPARALVDAGAAIALASNFHPRRTPTYNMQTVIAIACLQMELTAAEAISAATINGAHALGCADRTGSLEIGKCADLIILNISDYRELTEYFGVNLVHLTMKRGKFIYKEAKVGVQ